MYGYHLEAEYSTGFVLDSLRLDDVNPFGPGSTFTAIVTHAPKAAGYGSLIRFALLPDDHGDGLAVDWPEVERWNLDDPEPFYERKMAISLSTGTGGAPVARCIHHEFGYRYSGADGFPVMVTERLVPR